jgi:hypothetical protein
MSNRRFIELSSSNRNRIQYPQPAEFEVPFAPSRSLNVNQTTKGTYKAPNGTTNTVYAQTLDIADTVTNGIVEYQWTGGNALLDSGTITQTAINVSIINVSGLSFPNTNYGTTPSWASPSISINKNIPISILSSTPTQITLFSPVSVSSGDSFIILANTTIIDQTTVQSTSSLSSVYVNVSSLWSPYKDVYNFYTGYQLSDGLSNSIISSYTPSSGLFTFKVPLNPPNPVIINDTITITDPSSCGNSVSSGIPNILVLPAVDQTGKTILQYDQAYHNYYVIDETQSIAQNTIIYSKVVSYDFLSNTVTLENPLGTNWVITDSYSLRKTLPSQMLRLPLLSSLSFSLPYTLPFSQITLTQNCIFLPSNASQIDNFYAGQYIYMYPSTVINNQTTPLSNIEGVCFYIISYIGNGYNACFVAPVSPPNVPSPTQYYPSYTSVASPLSPAPGNVINIVSFSNDNYTPLIYNGSVVSQNETVAYEISLVNLTLPNSTLVTGARIAYYSYIYVELSNVTASSSSSKNIIYSNNPNSNRALFLVPITDINDPQRSPFIKLDAGSMVQTVKFKPNDCLRFSVFLPDGTLYQTITSDYYSPSAPNPLVQIDALFGIKRLSGV